MAMVKQQAFILRIAGVHSSLERRIKIDFMLQVFSLVRYLKGLRSFVLYLQPLNAELVFATRV